MLIPPGIYNITVQTKNKNITLLQILLGEEASTSDVIKEVKANHSQGAERVLILCNI